MKNNVYIYILVMAVVIYLIRLLPLTLIRKKITNKTLRSFLYYVPYVTLAVMTFPAIIERKLHKETINLGFSGNGRMDKIMADKIATIPASAYVIDCIANCTYDIVKDSTDYFIRTIAKANPQTPIYMVSNYFYPSMYLDFQWRADAIKENKLWKEFCDKFRKEGYNVKYIDVFVECNSKKSPLGPDYEACVDGIHFTDMGFARVAEFFIKKLKF